MKLTKIWPIIILISIAILLIGKIKDSHIIIFIGAVGTTSGIICEGSSLIIHWIKREVR